MAELGEPRGRLGRVALVLATWGRTREPVLSRASDGADVVVHKPHPHDGTPAGHPGVVDLPGSWIPAEALVHTLAGVCEHLTVYHHSSSVAFYLADRHANVDYVDVMGSTQLRDVLAAARG